MNLVLSVQEAARLRVWIDLSRAQKECGGEVGADTAVVGSFKTVHRARGNFPDTARTRGATAKVNPNLPHTVFHDSPGA